MDKTITVGEYRELIDAVSQWRVSVQSAATANEQRSEGERLRRAAEDLRSAVCHRIGPRDRQRADSVLAVADALLSRLKTEWQSADSNLAKMAFGKDWR